MTRISLPMTRTFGCPCPHPSSSALFFSIPKLAALLRLLALTTACARLNRDDSGCSGIVYFNKVTANARTSGARFVYRTVLASSSSVATTLGRARDSSIAAGVMGISAEASFLRLLGDSGRVSPEDLFFVTRLAALRICLASFSSAKMS